jgi:hypothetical protein
MSFEYDKIEWQEFVGRELTEEDIKLLIEDSYFSHWLRGVHNISTGDTKVEFSNDGQKTIVEVYKRTKLGIIPRKSK